MRLKEMMFGGAALAVVAAMSTTATAMPIVGAIDFGGQVTVASAVDITGVDFVGNGFVIATQGDFSSVGIGSTVGLTDIDFSSPTFVWSVAGFRFEATDYSNITLNTQQGKDFTAEGFLTGPGFDRTFGIFEYSSQASSALASFSSSTISRPPSQQVVEPATLGLLGIGLLGAGVFARRRMNG